MVQHYPELQESQQQAESSAREQLKDCSLTQILDAARSYYSRYQELTTQSFEEQGWISSTYFGQMLSKAYPDADDEAITGLSREIEHTIVEQLGEPATKIEQSDLLAASTRHDTAVRIASQQLNDEQLRMLEEQARSKIDSDSFPENFDDHKAEWLADWVTRGVIALP